MKTTGIAAQGWLFAALAAALLATPTFSQEAPAPDELTQRLVELIRASEKQVTDGNAAQALKTLEEARALAEKAKRPELAQIESRIRRIEVAEKARELEAAKTATPAPAAGTAPAAASGTPAAGTAPAPAAGTAPAPAAGEAPKIGMPPTAAALMAEVSKGMRLSLIECVEIAVQNNLGLRITRLSDRASDLDLQTAWAAFLPQIDASLGNSGGQTSGNHFNTTALTTSVTQRSPWGTTATISGEEDEGHPGSGSGRSSRYGVSVSQPLWRGFGTDVGMFQVRTARLGKLISRGGLELALQQTIFQVRTAYANCVRQLQALEVNKRAVESATTFLRLTQAREQAGQQTRLDVYNAEVQLADRQLALTVNLRQLEDSFDALKQIMDVDLEERIAVEEEPVDFGDKPAAGEERVIETDDKTGTVRLVIRKGGKPEGQPLLLYQAQHFDEAQVLADALKNRIDLLNSKRNLALQNLSVLLKKDGLGQQVDLTLGYDRSNTGRNWSDSHGFENHDYTAMVRYSLPWGKVTDKAAYERALLEMEKSEVQLKQARTQVQADVRGIMRTLRQTETTILIQGNKVEQAKRLVDAERVRFERGIKDSFDVITAEDNLLSAKNDFINQKVSYVVNLAQLETVVGKPTGRVDLSAKSPGGEVEIRLPRSLIERGLPKPAPEPDAKLEDKY